jgi:hypothetical protein
MVFLENFGVFESYNPNNWGHFGVEEHVRTFWDISRVIKISHLDLLMYSKTPKHALKIWKVLKYIKRPK